MGSLLLAVISPAIMALALKLARWNEGYCWTACVQAGILLVVLLSLPLWKRGETADGDALRDSAGIGETLKVPGVVPSLIAFFSYCAGEATCFLWTPSYFAGTWTGLPDERIAACGSLVFGHLQQAVGIGIMPAYLLFFALMNLGLLELAYRKLPC